jgi:hypothetical protein
LRLKSIHKALIKHKEFLNILAGEDEAKESLVVLLHTIYSASPKICQENVFPILLRYYNARLEEYNHVLSKNQVYTMWIKFCCRYYIFTSPKESH